MMAEVGKEERHSIGFFNPERADVFVTVAKKNGKNVFVSGEVNSDGMVKLISVRSKRQSSDLTRVYKVTDYIFARRVRQAKN